MTADGSDDRPRSLSPYDYSAKSIRHAWIAVLAYAGLRSLSAIIGGLQQPAMAMWFVVDFAVVAIVLGLLAFGIYKKSRIAVVTAIIYIVATQLYVWFVIGSPAGTIVAVIVTGFLLRGARRIFDFHRERDEAAAG
jgi:hypothetical protein